MLYIKSSIPYRSLMIELSGNTDFIPNEITVFDLTVRLQKIKYTLIL